MGFGTVEMPHLAIGGMPDLPSADLSNSTLQPAGAGLDLPHYGTVDFRHDGGDHRVIAHENTMRNLKHCRAEGQAVFYRAETVLVRGRRAMTAEAERPFSESWAMLGAAVELAEKIVRADPAELVAIIKAGRLGMGTVRRTGTPHSDAGNSHRRGRSSRVGRRGDCGNRRMFGVG